MNAICSECLLGGANAKTRINNNQPYHLLMIRAKAHVPHQMFNALSMQIGSSVNHIHCADSVFFSSLLLFWLFISYFEYIVRPAEYIAVPIHPLSN